MGFRTFTTVGEVIWYYFSPVCGSPTWWEWDLIFNHDYVPPTVLLGLLLSLWTWEYLFLVDSSILLMVVQQLVVILMLSWEEMSELLCIPPS